MVGLRLRTIKADHSVACLVKGEDLGSIRCHSELCGEVVYPVEVLRLTRNGHDVTDLGPILFRHLGPVLVALLVVLQTVTHVWRLEAFDVALEGWLCVLRAVVASQDLRCLD